MKDNTNKRKFKYADDYWDLILGVFLAILSGAGMFYLIGIIFVGLISFITWKSIFFVVFNFLYLRISVVMGLLLACKYIWDNYNGKI